MTRADWDALATGEPPVLVFWYRRADSALEPRARWQVGVSDPPADEPGMAGVTLDTRGRLRSFYAVPSPLFAGKSTGAVDWDPFFAEAGLDRARFEPAEPALVPRRYADALAAWTGTYPENPAVTVRVEAASREGRPVSFEVLHAWDVEAATRPPRPAPPVTLLLVAVFVFALAGSLLLAARNLRMGRGDRRGAMRLAVTVAGATLLMWAFVARHRAGIGELWLFLDGTADALLVGAFVWLVYVALEPFARRRWPELLVSWSRLLAGKAADPLVGRDVLVGLFAGASFLTTVLLTEWAAGRLGGAPIAPKIEPGAAMLGLSWFPYAFLMQVVGAVVLALHALFVLVFAAALTRRRLLAAAVCWLVAFLLLGPVGNAHNPAGWPFAAMTALIGVSVLSRFGLLAFLTAIVTAHSFVFFPITTELGAWYAAGFVADLVVLGAVALLAFRASVAGQPLFPSRLEGV